MTLSRSLILTSVLLIGGLGSSAFARDCEAGATAMGEVLACQREEAETRLRAAFERTHSEVRAQNPRAAEALTQAQESWRKFATDSCAYTALATPGRSYEIEHLCWQTFIRARVQILEAYRRELQTPASR